MWREELKISSRNSSHVLLFMLFRQFKRNQLLVLNKREGFTIHDNHMYERKHSATVRSQSLAWRTADRLSAFLSYKLRPIGKWKETEKLWKMYVEIARKFSSSSTQYHWLNILTRGFSNAILGSGEKSSRVCVFSSSIRFCLLSQNFSAWLSFLKKRLEKKRRKKSDQLRDESGLGGEFCVIRNIKVSLVITFHVHGARGQIATSCERF